MRVSGATGAKVWHGRHPRQSILETLHARWVKRKRDNEGIDHPFNGHVESCSHQRGTEADGDRNEDLFLHDTLNPSSSHNPDPENIGVARAQLKQTLSKWSGIE